ncbi:MAG: 16S rRNA (guanine(966)-N(2))-methyltransferase RsmD [Cyanobacteria bacterium M5B4]|nr:MAG: 16S rRNA (guanine(966)-N(2))-methyltransferase RsmD [Cyanobacteria bacterium M5B4]
MNLRIQGDRLLKTPKTVRPTPSKIRSALFNIWQPWLMDCRWLDLCAGSGAMGAEALLRGAGKVVAIEVNSSTCKIISENLHKVSTTDRFQVVRADAIKAISKLTETFDLIYFDPPYASDLYLPVLTTIHRLCHSETKIAVEHSSYHPLPLTIGNLEQTDDRVYGQTRLSFFALGTSVLDRQSEGN